MSKPWFEDENYGYQPLRGEGGAVVPFTGPISGRGPTTATNDPDHVKIGGSTVRCCDTHPPLEIKHVASGKSYQIWGGSCLRPNPEWGRFDVEVGFDSGMRRLGKQYPWDPKRVEQVLVTVQDSMGSKSPKEYRKLVDWVACQLIEGKRVHAGCIGGHGRTGMFLAALYAHMTGEKDAIKHVRDHYCAKAVESPEQVDFLVKHFGITKAQGAKFKTYAKAEPKTTTVEEDREKFFNRKGYYPDPSTDPDYYVPTPNAHVYRATGSSGGPTEAGTGMSALDWQRYMAGLDKKLGGSGLKAYLPEVTVEVVEVKPMRTRGTIWHRTVDERGDKG